MIRSSGYAGASLQDCSTFRPFLYAHSFWGKWVLKIEKIRFAAMFIWFMFRTKTSNSTAQPAGKRRESLFEVLFFFVYLRLSAHNGVCIVSFVPQALHILIVPGNVTSSNSNLSSCFVLPLSFRAERSGVEKSAKSIAGERISPLACGSVEMTVVVCNSAINWNFVYSKGADHSWSAPFVRGFIAGILRSLRCRQNRQAYS